jgi:hypothetical protein
MLENICNKMSIVTHMRYTEEHNHHHPKDSTFLRSPQELVRGCSGRSQAIDIATLRYGSLRADCLVEA